VSVPLIYNLFPLLAGPTTRWAEHAGRAAGMGFDWLYLNPWHYPGFSGSLYAPKHLRQLNPLFLPPGADPHDLEPLREALRQVEERGLRPMMDLVINHTARDSPLIDEHPDWFVRGDDGEVVSPFVRDPDDPSKVTVWGDLAEVDNRGGAEGGADHEGAPGTAEPGREGLWEFWEELVREALALGFRGFRCDAAYMVPARLWRRLIAAAREVDPEAQFFAETLGGPLEAVRGLREAGFDFIFNSSKWWDFRAPWALEQHAEFRELAPSISFPESHDTPRLAEESGGSEAVQRQRYAFAAAFSAGVMMPVGYEFGFRRPLHVVETRPSDWERKRMDLRPFVARVNALKRAHPYLRGEGLLSAGGEQGAVVVLQRRPSGDAPPGFILINTDAGGAAEVRLHEAVGAVGGAPGVAGELRLHRVCRDGAPEGGEAVPERLELDAAEVAYLLPG
jgi:starch synthase (maltosyl-transferring)